ncbi:MAG TPA: response regulator transcription factor [Anaerolineales bacterium]|jgi:DNA-binding response OmpR family regulator
MKARILWIEGKRADGPSFIPGLRKKGFLVDTVPTGKAALARIVESATDLVVVDAASLRTSGKRICHDIRAEKNGLPILLIANPNRPDTQDDCANIVLKQPFTIRKLVNRILPLLPAPGNNSLQAGPIELDLKRKLVRCDEREARLTPRLAHLLKILMEHPGEVLERERLFREVWNTEYTGDTRTLDVHISWLRQAIETSPRQPRFLKTIRGVGYRLDV